MKIKLISIGNSKGIRIPRSVIEQCGFSYQIEMCVGNGVVELTRTRETREDWEAGFEAMAKTGDDTLLFPDDMAHDWDEAEWAW